MRVRLRKVRVFLTITCLLFVIFMFAKSPVKCPFERNVEDMTLKDLHSYFTWKNRTSCSLVHNFGGTVYRDGIRGQRAVCMDPLLRPVRVRNCIAYSFGKDTNFSFAQAMIDFNCDTYVFGSELPDVGIKKPEMLHKYPEIELGVKNTGNFMTLIDIYRMFNHIGKVIDYVSINVAPEVDIMEEIIKSKILLVTRQLSISLQLPKSGDVKELRRRGKLLKELEGRRFVRFDSKREDWGYIISWYNQNLRRKKAYGSLEELEAKKKSKL